MNSLKKKSVPPILRTYLLLGVFVVAGLIMFAKPHSAQALTCTSQSGGGNWSDSTKWSCSRVPTTADTAVIASGANIVVDQNTAGVISITINDGATLSTDNNSRIIEIGTTNTGTAFTNSGTFTAGNSTVRISSNSSRTIFSGTFTGSSALNNLEFTPALGGARTYTMGAAFTVSGNWTSNPSSSVDRTLTVNLGGTTIVVGVTTLDGEGCSTSDNTAGQTALNTTSANNHAFTTGSINLKNNGEICTLTANASTITLTGTSGTLMTNGNSGSFVHGTSDLVVTSSSGTPTIFSAAETLYKLTLNCSGCTATTGGATTVSNNLTITAGTLQLGTNNFTVTGTSAISGTLADSSSTGTNLFTGKVTFNGNGTWNNSGAAALEFQGGIDNSSNGAVNIGSGAVSLTSSQAMEGSQNITFGGTVTISGNVVITNNNTAIVHTVGDLSGSNPNSQWIQGVNSYLKVSGTAMPSNGKLDVSAAGNTVEYAGTDQDMTAGGSRVGNFQKLIISGTNVTSPTLTIDTSLTISGSWTPSSGTLTLPGSGTVFNNNGGTFTASGSHTTTITNTGTVTIASTNDNVRFFDFTASAGGTTLKFTSGRTFRTDGTLTLASITITSTDEATKWFINHQGSSESVTNLTLSFGGCNSSTDITVTSGTSVEENEACWLFPSATSPTVSTVAASSVTVISAVLNGNITATGGDNATVRGFAWGTDSTLTTVIATSTETGDFSTGPFSQAIGTLLSGVTYYFRAYATNPNGTGYGEILNFTAGVDTTPSRRLRLFEGFTIKFISGQIILHQR